MNIYRSLCACFVAFACASVTLAANDVWDANGANPPNGFWGTGANWADNTTPGLSDTAAFNLAGAYTVTFNASPAQIVALSISNGNLTFASSGGPRTLQLQGSLPTSDMPIGGASTLTLGTSGNPLHLTKIHELSVNGNASLNVNAGSQASGNRLRVGALGNGTVVVNGLGSQLNMDQFSITSSQSYLGLDGHTGVVTYRNAASGNFLSDLFVANSNAVGTTGTLSVESDADLTTYALSLAASPDALGAATLNIHGNGSTVLQAPVHGHTGLGNAIVVGNATSGTAAINIGVAQSGGSLTTGNGGLTINNTGTVTVGAGSNTGSLVVNGPAYVSGGNLAVEPGSTFTANGGLSVGSYGSASVAGNFGNNVSVSTGGSLSVGGTIYPGPLLIASDIGSSVTAAGVYLTADATATFNNGASGTFSVGIAVQPNLAGAAQLNIESGAQVSTGVLSLYPGSNSSSAVTITGSGSTLNIFNPADSLNIGNSFSLVEESAAVVNVFDGAYLSVSAGGTTKLNHDGMLNIDGGTVDLGTLDYQGGVVNLSAGSLSYVGDLTVGSGGMFGNNPILNGGQHLTLSGTTTIESDRTLTLAGGTLNTGTLSVAGEFNFLAGTLSINQASAVVEHPFNTGPNTVISLDADNITLGDVASVAGFQHQGVLLVPYSATLNSASYADLGIGTALYGGTINAPNGVSLGSDSNFQGYGTINTRVVGELGALILADGGNLVMGDAASPAGFNFAGELRTKQYVVTLRSSARAGLGNLTVLGNGSNRGTLVANNGYVVDFDEAVTGYGTITSTNTLAKRAIINGIVQGNSVARPITLSGYIKGDGTFNNVVFTGTFDPGFSPTILTVGNVAFSPTSKLIIELGGETPGSDHDQLQSSGTLTFDGLLQVLSINSFSPSAGQSFNLFDWVDVGGTFDTINLPVLAGSLQWNTSHLYVDGTLSVVSTYSADFDGDGDVDRTDLTHPTLGWEVRYGVDLDGSDFLAWQQQYGLPGLGGMQSPATAVPEPASSTLLLALLAAVMRGHRKNGGFSPRT